MAILGADRILWVLVLGIFAFLSKTVYNVWFHPLAKYPGPLLSRASDFSYWSSWLAGRLPQYTKTIHEIYGTKVRLSPNRISFIEPDALKDLYGHKNTTRTLRVVKDPAMYVDNPHMTEHSMFTEGDDAKHARLRKIFSPGFSDRALKAQEGLIRAHADKLIKNVYQEAAAGNKIDIVKYYNCATFDIIGELAFGESLGLLDDSELNTWVKNILHGLEGAAFYALLLSYPALGFAVNLLLGKKFKEASAKNAEYSAIRVQNRMQKGKVTEKPDFWTLVLAQHEAGALNLEQMKANADLFMVAGSETTATMLAGLMYNFMLNSDKARKAAQEVRMAFKNEDELTIENIQGLKYLNACFNESMRVYPSGPVGGSRLVTQAGTICEDVFDVGVVASVAPFAAYHSPSNFKNPQKFVPERWLEEAPEYGEYANDRREAFEPFSVGLRNCIGKNLALHEMRIIACKMLWHFDFELCEGNKGNWFDQKCFWALWSKPPLYVRATPVRGREL